VKEYTHLHEETGENNKNIYHDGHCPAENESR